VLSTPSVIYKVLGSDGKEFFVRTPSEWPETSRIGQVQELWTKLQILTPSEFLGQVLELLDSVESKYLETQYLGAEKTELVYEVPLREIINKNFYDKLKGISKGFASMNYEIIEWRTGDFSKLDILVLGRKEEALSKIVSQKEAMFEGRKIVEKLKETLPPQLYAVPLQASVGGKIIARETVKALRRDVIAPLYGGDYTRKRKLLEKQKKGKKKLKDRGKIYIPTQVFLEMFRR
jgi:GTP-binding protein LepA